MKSVTISLIVIFFSLALQAQRLYFVYIQSDDNKPFFLTVNETIHSSTPSGYLIWSKLKDSTYRFTIGFANNTAPEQKFSIAINKKDHGYILKNFGTKGWGLFDLQTMAVQMSTSVPAVSNVDFAVLRTTVDPFTAMLSRATDDPTLLQKIVIPRPEQKKPEVVKKDDSKNKPSDNKKDVTLKTGKTTSSGDTPEKKADVKTDDKKGIVADQEKTTSTETDEKKVIGDKIAGSSDSIKSNQGTVQNKGIKDDEKTVVKNELPETPVEKKVDPKTVVNDPIEKTDVSKNVADATNPELKQENQYSRSRVVKRSESSTTEGFGLVFIDEDAAGQKDTIRILISNDKGIGVANETKVVKQDKKFLDIDDPDTIKNGTTPEKKDDTQPIVTPGVKSIRSNACSQLASESDFFKLRKRMASQSKEDNMVEEAKKSFRTKCYTTEQVKNLSALFLTNGGKYKFFDTAYSHVSDLEKFPSLESELKDEYFIRRFKAIIY